MPLLDGSAGPLSSLRQLFSRRGYSVDAAARAALIGPRNQCGRHMGSSNAPEPGAVIAPTSASARANVSW